MSNNPCKPSSNHYDLAIVGAATSSLVIASMIVDEAQRSFDLASHEKV